VAVVDFWASWCGPCRQEITDCLKPLYEQYADSGLVIVGVGVWDKMEDFERAVMDLSISYTQIIDTTKTVPTLYGFNSIPQLFLIDRDGTLLGNYRGEELVREVEKALKKEDN
jgi:thiol-disulfide isomerase/thioredoxin